MIRAAAIAAVVAVALAAPAGAQSFPTGSRLYKLCWMEDETCWPTMKRAYDAAYAKFCGRPTTMSNDDLYRYFMEFAAPTSVGSAAGSQAPPNDFWRMLVSQAFRCQ